VYAVLVACAGAFALRSIPQKKEQESMGGEDKGQNVEELALRMKELAQKLEVLERENRELREALGSGASDRELERTQQQP
jgi:cell shape-determining protein MreC